MEDIVLQWTGADQFKARVDTKTVFLQYILEGGYYTIWFDEAGTKYKCSIKYTTPTPEGSDQEDFEDNYKSSCNKKTENLTLPDNAFSMQTDAVAWEFTKNDVSSNIFKIENHDVETFMFKYLSGADWKVFNSVKGDWAKFQVIDHDNILGMGVDVVLKEYVRKKYVWNETPTECVAMAPGKILVGLYLRCIYTSVGTETNPEMYINFRIETKEE